MNRPARLITYEPLDFARAWRLQHRLVRRRLAERCPDTLLLLEHEPVLTVGRSGVRDPYLAEPYRAGNLQVTDRGLPIFYVERGGSITYHGPGQLVGYPILHLRSYCTGPKEFMRLLEEVLIRVLAEWGIAAHRVDQLRGVWVGENPARKIASMGVRISRGVTMHGFALNVDTDLEPFDHIVPCGIAGCRVTSMAQILGRPVDLGRVRARIAATFAEVFGLTWTHKLRHSRKNARANALIDHVTRGPSLSEARDDTSVSQGLDRPGGGCQPDGRPTTRRREEEAIL